MSKLSTKHVVLGLMIDRSSYGYGLQQQIAERLGFLGLAESAVYKTIERLEADGWIEEAGEKRVGRTRRGVPRILYRATPEGVVQFRDWMARPTDRSALRDELQAKLALSTPTDLPQLLRMAETQQQECLAELATLSRPGLASAGDADVQWSAAARMMVDDFKARWLESLVDWLTAICEVMEERIRRTVDDRKDLPAPPTHGVGSPGA
jgi:DNA-binding PadR family transcriptional regulator